MTKRRFQLDTGAVFLRLAVCFFVLREAFVWLVWMRRVRARLGVRLVFFLFRKWATPHSVLYALMFAAFATTLLYLLVRVVLEPLVRSWLTPWTDGSAGLFHVAANERVLASSPGRRATGRRWMPGTLVLTNLRLWFFPRAHDADIWSRPLDVLGEIHLEPAPWIAWGYIRGWPERLSVRAADDGQGDGVHELFAIPDPEMVIASFDRSGTSSLVACASSVEPKESLMPANYSVVITDFLEEANIEAAVLGDIARITLAAGFSEADLADHLADADALILFHEIALVGAETFSRAPRCKCIIRAGVGYNNVDRAAAAKHGVIVCNVPDYGTEEVADHAIMFLLALARKLLPSDAAIRAGDWDYRTAIGTPRLRGRTLGVVGCGRIGTATALRAKAFGLDVVFYDPLVPQGLDKALGIRRVFRLEELLEQSHFVSLHCYLDQTTHHLIDARALARLRPDAFLINTARGPVVDQVALVQALDSGGLAGAGIDVVEREPLDHDRLRHHPRVILTPHSAFYSVEGFVELRTKAAEEVRRILLGEPPRNSVSLVK